MPAQYALAVTAVDSDLPDSAIPTAGAATATATTAAGGQSLRGPRGWKVWV